MSVEHRFIQIEYSFGPIDRQTHTYMHSAHVPNVLNVLNALKVVRKKIYL